MIFEPGKMLCSYRLVERLGAGGMGVVWEAVDTRLDRAVALKVLPADVVHTADQIARFEREAKAVASLNHPNIVTLYSVEEAGDEPPLRFITMELVEGPTLDLGFSPEILSQESEFRTLAAEAEFQRLLDGAKRAAS